MKRYWHIFYTKHFEWVALTGCLLAAGLMNPYTDQGSSLCLFEWAGFHFCPGHGLAHSIAFIFRGDLNNALQANILGPIAIVVLLGRVLCLFKNLSINSNQ